jgi:hypothetical protein
LSKEENQRIDMAQVFQATSRYLYWMNLSQTLNSKSYEMLQREHVRGKSLGFRTLTIVIPAVHPLTTHHTRTPSQLQKILSQIASTPRFTTNMRRKRGKHATTRPEDSNSRCTRLLLFWRS